jgi:hypothetical protein
VVSCVPEIVPLSSWKNPLALGILISREECPWNSVFESEEMKYPHNTTYNYLYCVLYYTFYTICIIKGYSYLTFGQTALPEQRKKFCEKERTGTERQRSESS